MPRHACLFAVLAMLALPRTGSAQDRLVDRPAFYLGLDVLVGGGAAVVHALAKPDGPSVGAAFIKGAFGGAVMYGGQRMVGGGEPALRLAGVQTVAVGASIARNAGAGVPVLSDLTFPLYPFYLHVRPRASRPVSVRLSALGVAALGWAAASNGSFDARIDWAESALTGAPVFRSDASWIYPIGPAPASACAHGDGCDGRAAGLHRLGTTWFTTGGRSAGASHDILTHETVHLTQTVRDAILFGVPAGDAALDRAGGLLARARRFIALDALQPLGLLNSGLARTLPHTRHGNPWRLYELEAKVLAGQVKEPW